MHASIVCMTGGGKGVAMNSLGLVPREMPVVIFDVHGEYDKFAGRRVVAYRTRNGLKKGLAGAWVSGKPFAISYTPSIGSGDRRAALREEAYWLADMLWKISDGRRRFAAVFEELGEYAEGNAEDSSPIGRIWTGGRKFGIWGIAVFQRSAEVPKTIWNNSPRKVIGVQGGIRDKKRVVDELGCAPDEVDDLGVRNVALSMHSPELGEVVRTKTHYLYSESAGSYRKVAAYVKKAEKLRANYSSEQRALESDGVYQIGV